MLNSEKKKKKKKTAKGDKKEIRIGETWAEVSHAEQQAAFLLPVESEKHIFIFFFGTRVHIST